MIKTLNKGAIAERATQRYPERCSSRLRDVHENNRSQG
jgi:hypothetical protein